MRLSSSSNDPRFPSLHRILMEIEGFTYVDSQPVIMIRYGMAWAAMRWDDGMGWDGMGVTHILYR